MMFDFMPSETFNCVLRKICHYFVSASNRLIVFMIRVFGFWPDNRVDFSIKKKATGIQLLPIKK